jgi:hypothetical protein
MDHHRSTPGVGPGAEHRSVSMTVPSMLTWPWPASLAAWRAVLRMGCQCPGVGAGAASEAFGDPGVTVWFGHYRADSTDGSTTMSDVSQMRAGVAVLIRARG